MVFISVFGSRSHSNFTWFHNLDRLQFLLLNYLSLPDICITIQNVKFSLLILDVFNDKVVYLSCSSFSSLMNLLTLNLSDNAINTRQDLSFINLYSLKILELSNNNIKSLTMRMLFGTENLSIFRVYRNQMIHLDVHMLKHFSHIKLIQTDNFRLCCIRLNKKSICTASVEWPASREDLISHTYVNISMWIITLLVIVSNLASLIDLALFKNTETESKACFGIIAKF